MYVYSNKVCNESGKTLATFSSHWAAVVALIRIEKPEFKSLNGDKEADLIEELKLKDFINNKI